MLKRSPVDSWHWFHSKRLAGKEMESLERVYIALEYFRLFSNEELIQAIPVLLEYFAELKLTLHPSALIEIHQLSERIDLDKPI